MAAELGKLVDCFRCGEGAEAAPAVSPSIRAGAQTNGRAHKAAARKQLSPV
jgi:hypothetical protein